ncbi:MAG: glycine zipper 2TM domain-containing protein [Thermodesulfovibrionales bacterium]|nr:glycine zipper 2TM domain-containing protein [Thermodesulfovibrionales bacterium]
MIRRVKQFWALMVIFVLLAASCSTYHYEGAAAGGAVGGVAGALLDSKNHWRGGVIGAALGALAGATIADVSVRGSRDAAKSGRPVEYRTEDNRGYYRAEPVGQPYYPNEQTKCRKVNERVWEDGRLVKDTVKEVCEGERYERRY